MIYLVTDGKYLKVGYTEDIDSRIKGYSTHSNNFTILSFKEGSVKDESFLHKKYQKYHVRDEWFEYSQEIIDGFNSYKPVNESSNEIEVTLYSSQLKDIYKNCTGYSMSLYMIILEEMRPPGRGFNFNVFTTTEEDKSRWAKKLGVEDPHGLNYGIKMLRNNGMIIKLKRGIYVVNPKFAFCGDNKLRFKALQELGITL